MEFVVFILLVVIVVLLVQISKLKSNVGKKEHEIESIKAKVKIILQEKIDAIDSLQLKNDSLSSEVEALSIYKPIIDIEQQINKMRDSANLELAITRQEMSDLVKSEREKSKRIKEIAEAKIEEAHSLSDKIINDAKQKAINIAGEAWEAKTNAEQYAETAQAMSNIIKGYGDEYLIPGESLLDDLAEDYDHTEAGRELARVKVLIKSMIKNGMVADCDYVEHNRRVAAIDFVIDAFNGKVDSIMSKVKYDNYGVLLQRLQDAYRVVNHNGQPFRNARILSRYFDVIQEQLQLAVTVSELKKKDREEQREIREIMREEERARREYEKALKESQKEERLIAKAIKEAEARVKEASDTERAKYELKLASLQTELAVAIEKGQRAISMAQQTKTGHVYVISNVGSFGEDVFKIGLTRRLDPLDRVKELGDASVPFSFDVHAMIHSEDAPALERELQLFFKDAQINKVNPRKEFFRVALTKIKDKVQEMDLETHWTMKADAIEYRESLQIEKQNSISMMN